MEEIKVGEYVRTIDGYIRKVEQVNRKGSYDGLCHGAYNVDIPYKYSQGISAKKIKSHSPNIIDLIEQGDYVNGVRILDITGDYIHTAEWDCCKERLRKKLKSIVTKEQFSRMEYKLEE
jgi:hypothetical protein